MDKFFQFALFLSWGGSFILLSRFYQHMDDDVNDIKRRMQDKNEKE